MKQVRNTNNENEQEEQIHIKGGVEPIKRKDKQQKKSYGEIVKKKKTFKRPVVWS